MWSDSIGELLTALLDAGAAERAGAAARSSRAAKRGPDHRQDPSLRGAAAGSLPDARRGLGRNGLGHGPLAVQAEFAFSFTSKARFEVIGTLHTYGETSATSRLRRWPRCPAPGP